MKIAIYYNNVDTLGHATRLLALLKGIKENIPRCRIVLLAGDVVPMFLPLRDYAEVVMLPYGADWKGNIKGETRKLSNQIGHMFRERFARVRSVLKGFHPDIFLVDHFPFGQGPWFLEMPFILDYVKDELGCKVFGSAGYLNYAERLYENVDHYFDRILVHTPRPLALTYMKHLDDRSAGELTRVVRAFKDKIDFTGFVFDRPESLAAGRLRDERWKKGFEKMVLVSRGGGVWNDRIIVSALLAARKKKEWWFIVCCGPATGAKEMRMYNELARGAGNVKLVHFLPPEDFDRYLAAADIGVSLTGYNAALKLLFFRKRAVLVPHDISEQIWRAKLLSNYIPAVILTSKNATADRLVAAMEAVLKKTVPRKKMPADWFEGASQTAGILACQN